MDTSSITASNVPPSQLGDAVQFTVLRRAMDIQAATAGQLIEAAAAGMAQAAAAVNPPHLGNRIDTFA